MRSPRVLVVGGGNAALCAAHAAREAGADVRVFEAAPEEERGGNSRFTAGAMRVVYDGVDDLRELMPDLVDDEVARTDFGTYPAERFFEDMARVTQDRCDPDLCEALVTRSRDTLRWMRSLGVRFAPIWGRQAFRVDGRYVFWGGLTVEAWGGGPGLVDALGRAADARGIGVACASRAVRLVERAGRVTGVVVRHGGEDVEHAADAVVLACGGFESNAAWRAQYLGPGWDLARVRGTRHNQGDGLRMALDAGASPAGHWSGCHAVGWDRNAPEFGDLAVGDGFQKHSYPFGIMVNARGARFVDEGADFRNYTYARYGRVILEQPGQFAWQVFDRKTLHLLRDEYRIRQATRVRADTLETLADRMEGVDAAGFLAEIARYNAAVAGGGAFDPNRKDGCRTRGLAPDKTNWAQRIDEPPFEAYAVTCGITFTFGGLRVDPDGRVLGAGGSPVEGLYAAGEIVGGLFYFNYPGGTGLTSGAVFGRAAGTSAACDRRAMHG
jgi:tricarballylate dehydrogenase